MLTTENSGLTSLNFYCKKLKEEQIDFKNKQEEDNNDKSRIMWNWM